MQPNHQPLKSSMFHQKRTGGTHRFMKSLRQCGSRLNPEGIQFSGIQSTSSFQGGRFSRLKFPYLGNFWLNFFQPGILIQHLQWTSASNQDTSAVLFSLCWLFASPSEVDKFMERATAGGESEDEDVRNFHTETETSATSRKLLLVILYQFYILY